MRVIRIGVIGAGRIGKLHIQNAMSMPGVNVKAVSDVSLENVQRFAAEAGIGTVTNNYQDILADPDIDAVLICSSTNTHPQIIEASVLAGKHVFCEKPVSFDIASTFRAVNAAARTKINLQIGFNRRFDHNFTRIRMAVSQGSIGQPQIIKITSRDPEPPSADYIKVSGGLFMDMAIHDFDLARYLIGTDVDSVHVEASVLVDPIFEKFGDVDTAVTTLKFTNGVIGVIDNCRKAVYGYDQRVEVFGSGGCVIANNDFHNNVQFMTADNVHSDNPKYFFLERYIESYIAELKSFFASVREGGTVAVDGNDGLHAELIAHAAKLSWLEGRTVKVDEIREVLGQRNASL